MDMVVTDRQRWPVAGLTREDFAVFEDAQPFGKAGSRNQAL